MSEATFDPLSLHNFERGGSKDPIPPPKEKEQALLNKILFMYDEGKNERARWDGIWKKNWEFYMGKQWGPRPKWKASPVENYVFSKVETMLPILTDNRPRIHVLPREPKHQEYAESMQMLLSYLWDKLNSDEIVIQVTKNMLIFGKGFYYNYWDPDTDDIACESVDPQNIYVDKDATSIRDCRYLIHVSRMSKADILKFWPDAEDKFSQGARTVPDAVRKEGVSEAGDRSPIHVGNAYDDPAATSGTVPWMKADLSDVTLDDEMVQVLQVWIRDPSVLVAPFQSRGGRQFTDKTGRELFLEKQEFPGGRHVIVAGNRVIHDAPNPFEHGEFPYVEQDCHKVPGEFWSISAVQNLISPQMELNKALGQIIDNKNLMGNAQWVISKSSGIKPDQITAKPGLVIEKAPGSEVERVSPDALPSYITNFVDGRKQALDDISGVFDVTQGRKPTGITAGVAIETLQEAAQTRLRALVRNLENAIKRNGNQWVSLAQQFYDAARTVRVIDPNTGQANFVDLDSDKLRAQWEVIVAAGSTLPRSREVRQSQAVELFQLGVLDPQGLLEWIEHPGAEKIVERLRANALMKQELAMQGIDIEAAQRGEPGLVNG